MENNDPGLQKKDESVLAIRITEVEHKIMEAKARLIDLISQLQPVLRVSLPEPKNGLNKAVETTSTHSPFAEQLKELAEDLAMHIKDINTIADLLEV